jgi:type VI secretion system protein ImpA
MSELRLDDLLRPVEGPIPAGEDLRYTTVYAQIKEARRQDDDLAQGAWQRERKLADHFAVVKLASEAIASRSKDLQLAAWMTESLVKTRGFDGLRFGLELNLALVDRFWDHLYPAVEDGDLELRAAPLSWVGARLDPIVRAVPLVNGGYDWFAYKASRALGYESVAVSPEQKKAREKAIAGGAVTPEAFDKAFAETPKSSYIKAEADLDAALRALSALDSDCAQRFGDASPSFGKLCAAVEEVRHTVHGLLEKKRQTEPDPQAPAGESSQPQSTAPEAVADPAPNSKPSAPSQNLSDPLDEANEALRAGRAQEALQILNRDLATQSSGRGRFLSKLHLARLCLAAGKDQIAQPLLDDLAAAIDTHKLDEWEERETVASALVTILQASKRIQADAKEKQKFFERICRLDPGQALGC